MALTLPKVGDKPKKQVAGKVSAMPLPMVTQAEIEELDNYLNAHPDVSGKAEGNGFLVKLTAGGFDIYVAEDSTKAGKWRKLSDNSQVTPA